MENNDTLDLMPADDYFAIQEGGLQLLQLAVNINFYMSPVLLVVGTLGNIVCLVVLVRLSREVLSTCVYLAVLCVTDLVVLYTRCGNFWLVNIIGYDISWTLMTRYDIVCKSLPFAFNCTFHLSQWLLVAAAIEGVIATGYPQSVPRRCTLTNAKAVIMLMTAVLICVNVHFFWSFDIVLPPPVEPGAPQVYYCTFTQNQHRQSVFFQEIVFPTMNATVGEVLPIGMFMICVVIMAVCLARGRHRGPTEYQHWRQRYTMEPQGVEELVWMFVSVCLMTICLAAPTPVVNFVRYVVSSDDFATTLEFEERLMFFEETVCPQAQYCCVSLKIFVYAASSSRFRQELCSMFRFGVKKANVTATNTLTGQTHLRLTSLTVNIGLSSTSRSGHFATQAT